MALVEALDRIRITHQHHRRLLVQGTKYPDHVEHLGQADAGGQCTVASFLNHRSVSAGVGKRNTQFDDVRPGKHHGVHQLRRHVGVGIARCDIGYERSAVVCFERRQGGLDATHQETSELRSAVRVCLGRSGAALIRQPP